MLLVPLPCLVKPVRSGGEWGLQMTRILISLFGNILGYNNDIISGYNIFVPIYFEHAPLSLFPDSYCTIN